MAGQVTVWLQPLGQPWEVCGRGGLGGLGVVPESVQLTADSWGSATARFTLRRDVTFHHPDLSAWTPCIVEINGGRKWKGRVRETPGRTGSDAAMSIEGIGMPSHLEDDLFDRVYAHQKLADWKDQRSFLTADLGKFKAAGQVSNEGGITLMIPNGTVTSAAGYFVGVTLDLGPNPASWAKRVILEYTKNVSSTTIQTYIQGHDLEATDSTGFDATGQGVWNTLANDPTVLFGRKTFASARRYVSIYFFETFAGAIGADVWMKIKAIRVFSDTAYESGDASILKASDVVRDAISRATVLLSSDLSGIENTSFDIPEFAILGEDRSAREAWEAVDAFHRWVKKIDVWDRPIYKAQPTAPLFEMGAWSGSDFEDASAGSGQEIYNRGVVRGQGAAQEPVVVERWAGQALETLLDPISSPAPDNPSFVTNTASWTAAGGSTIARGTSGGQFHSAPAGGVWTLPIPSTPATLTETFTGTFKRGLIYLLEVWVDANYTDDPLASVPLTLTAEFGALAAGDYATYHHHHPEDGGIDWHAFRIPWVPRADRTGVTLKLSKPLMENPGDIYVDDLLLSAGRATLVDRRNFIRAKTVPIRSALTPPVAEKLGDVFLEAHRTTPFKGTRKALPGGVRRLIGGDPVHPSDLLTQTTELVCNSDMVDPDNGSIGRNGLISAVAYDNATEEAQVTFDNQRDNVEAVFERLAVVTGGG